MSENGRDEDPDLYGDDFSDSGYPNNNDNNEEDNDDEQHTQKVNGKVEMLEAELDELRQQLETEIEGHAKTKHALEDAITDANSARESAALAQESAERALATAAESKEIVQVDANQDRESDEVEHMRDDLEKYKKMVEQLQRQQSLDVALASGTSDSHSLPSSLTVEMREFADYCQRKLHTDDAAWRSKTVLDEWACIAIVKAARKGINALARKALEGEASNTAGGGGGGDLNSKVKNLEADLRAALGATEDIRALKAKLIQLIERNRVDKEQKLRAEADVSLTKKKLMILSDHMEKLMMHLKLESATKLRTVEEHRLAQKSVASLKEKCELMAKKSAAKDRLILELREGGKILEDQLRLMDEKYLELRTKLDYARETGNRKVKKAEKTAHDLRMKFALSGGSMLLDKMPLPDIFKSTSSTDINGNSGMFMEQQQQAESAGSWTDMIAAASASSRGGGGKFGGASTTGGKGGGKGKKSRHGSSVFFEQQQSEPSMDAILEKIRRHQGETPAWTEEKLKPLVSVSKSR